MGKVLSIPRCPTNRVDELRFRLRFSTANLAESTPLTIDQVLAVIQEAQRVYGLIQGLEGRCDKDVLLVLSNYLRALHGRAMRTCGLQDEPVKKLRVVR